MKDKTKKDKMIDENTKKELVKKAIDSLPNSYAPYSHYNVGAAALFESGNIYTGVNVESASLGGTLCAERNAISTAVTHGDRKLVAMAVAGGLHGDKDTDYCVPCGICRQVMRDFGNKDSLLVICAKSEDDYKEYTLEEMLPYSFGPEDLD